MALDIFEKGLEPDCHEMAVFSSDVDLCPAFRKVRGHGVKVRYVCFADHMNRAINTVCYKTMTISPAMAKAHFLGVMPDEDKPGKHFLDEYIEEN